MKTMTSLESVVEKGFGYNDGTGWMAPLGKGFNTGNFLRPDPFGLPRDPFSPSGPFDMPHRQPLANMTPSTNLYGNLNNAILNESLFKHDIQYENTFKMPTIDYHHHNNFNTKPLGDLPGYGGYMNLNIGGTPAIKQTMNFGYKDLTTPNFEERHFMKNTSNWLTQSQPKPVENYANNLLNNFNYSNQFAPKNIKNNNYLSLLGK